MKHLKDIIAEDHVLSGGVVFSYVLFMCGKLLLLQVPRKMLHFQLIENIHLCVLLDMKAIWFGFMSAAHILTTPLRGGNKGSFVGYSSGGLPLYNFTGERFQKTSHSVAVVLKSGLRQILEDSDSRKIFYFLCINLVSVLKLHRSSCCSEL